MGCPAPGKDVLFIVRSLNPNLRPTNTDKQQQRCQTLSFGREPRSLKQQMLPTRNSVTTSSAVSIWTELSDHRPGCSRDAGSFSNVFSPTLWPHVGLTAYSFSRPEF